MSEAAVQTALLPTLRLTGVVRRYREGDGFLEILRGAEVLVLNALFRTPHPTHLSVEESVTAARRVGAARTYLTHLTHQTAHAALTAELPADIQPAYDGLTVEIPDA